MFLYFNICISSLATAILDFPMHSNTNNKDISTSESAIPRNRAMTGDYSWLIVTINKKDGYRQQNVRQRQKLISIIDYEVCMTLY